MIVRLSKEQIAENWDGLKEAIVASFPKVPQDKDVWLNSLLQRSLVGDIQLWAAFEGGRICLVCATLFFYDPLYAGKDLLVTALYGYTHIPLEMWNDLKTTLVTFARAEKCGSVIGFSNVSRMIEVAREAGFNTQTVLLRLEV